MRSYSQEPGWLGNFPSGVRENFYLLALFSLYQHNRPTADGVLSSTSSTQAPHLLTAEQHRLSDVDHLDSSLPLKLRACRWRQVGRVVAMFYCAVLFFCSRQRTLTSCFRRFELRLQTASVTDPPTVFYIADLERCASSHLSLHT